MDQKTNKKGNNHKTKTEIKSKFSRARNAVLEPDSTAIQILQVFSSLIHDQTKITQ